MPELPEVQTTVLGINNKVTGQTITDIWTDYTTNNLLVTTNNRKNQIKNPKFFKRFKKEVVGKKIIGASRRAKNVLIHLSGDKTILVHMKMTGHLLFGEYRRVTNDQQFTTNNKKEIWVAEEPGPLQDPFNRFVHFVITLSNGKHLVLSDMRKFAKVTLFNTGGPDEAREFSHLGPEPLSRSFDIKELKSQLSKKPRGKIKTVLMDQTIISGIGNIYSDEILFSSNISPLRTIATLSEKESKLIFINTKKILKRGISLGGDSMSDYRNIDGLPGNFQNKHKAYRKTGSACSKRGCVGKIKRIVVGGRSAHYCPVHQT